ncbi:MAG: sensor histidine kinase [Bacteroidia bacterium]
MSRELEEIYKRICKLTGEKLGSGAALEKEIGKGLDKLEAKLKAYKEEEEENSRRITEVLKVVIYLANLRYDKKAPISDKKNHFDALALGINMLGEELKASTISLHEKEVLLKEIHHRVKNNLQVISSLLNLQSEKIKQPDLLETFMESQNRIRAMALVHEKLYQSNDLSEIDFTEYMHSFITYMNSTYNLDPENIRIHVNADLKPHLFKIDTAIPCSLILNELISNSCKYAFPNKGKGNIHLHFALEKETEKTAYYLLEVADDGVGIPDDIDIRNTNSLGLQLVDMLTQQIEGKVELQRSNGTKFTIRFPVPKS